MATERTSRQAMYVPHLQTQHSEQLHERQVVEVELANSSNAPAEGSNVSESAETAFSMKCTNSIPGAGPAAVSEVPSQPEHTSSEAARVSASPAGNNVVKRTLPWWNRRCCKCCGACTPACSFLALVGVFVVVLLVFSIGFSVERRNVKHLPFVFYGDSVCSVANETFPNASAAHASGGLIRHCGDCGQCSTAGDILTLEATVGTITDTGSACGVVGAFQGSDAAIKCFVERVNFTSDCARCWLENILCDIENCLFTCLLHRMGIGGGQNSPSGALSPCLECDEKVCGPAFKACAGAYRRTAGMYSEITRNVAEICTVVDVGPGTANNPNANRTAAAAAAAAATSPPPPPPLTTT